MRREWIEIYTPDLLSEPHGSPSMRREWIEIFYSVLYLNLGMSPSMRREWIEIKKQISFSVKFSGLPPCGGSGLKYLLKYPHNTIVMSPSMRREWIEIFLAVTGKIPTRVSLHAEGVD